MIFIGIDPGKSGGIASIVCGAAGVSIMDDSIQGILQTIQQILRYQDSMDRVHVFLEKGQTMPQNGGVHSYNYGHHNGSIEGILVALKLPYTLIKPQTWMKVMHVGTDSKLETKERSVQACRRIFPDLNLTPPRCRKPHDGMAEALLIAEYGRRSLTTAPSAS